MGNQLAKNFPTKVHLRLGESYGECGRMSFWIYRRDFDNLCNEIDCEDCMRMNVGALTIIV